MEGNNVRYMTPNEIRILDPSQISSLTMITGKTIYVNNSQTCSGTICDNCRWENLQNQNYILRAKKETTVQEGENGEKIEENVEIDVQAQPEGENNDQVLRGPDGMPLLNDILTRELEEEQNQEQQLVDENTNYQQQEQNNEQYNGNEGMNQIQTGEEQYVQELNEEMNYNENLEQYYDQDYAQDYNQDYTQDPNYYPPETQNDPNYPSAEMNNQAVQEEYVEQGNIDQYEQTQGQENMYPSLDENESLQYQEQEYQPPMNVPQESQEKEQEPPVEAIDQPPLQEPVQYPPTQQPNQLPIKPPVPKPQVAKEIKGYVPKKPGLPKKPYYPMGKGFPQPYGPHGPQRPMGRPGPRSMMPHGPMMPQSPRYKPSTQPKMGSKGKIIVINPIGAVLNAVHQVMAPIASMAAKGMKLRNTKPTTSNQGVQKTGVQQGSNLRAKPNVYNASYNKKGQTFSSKYTSQGYGYNYGNKNTQRSNQPKYGSQTYGKGKAQWSNQSNYGSQTYGKGNNYKFHEIVETSDNSKSYVVVKKGGETVSYDQ